MKALSLWQPWASLVVEGVKTIETRSWPAPQGLIGQRLAIHAAARRVEAGSFGEWTSERCDAWSLDRLWSSENGQRRLLYLPRGAIVGTCVVSACVPMVDDGAVGNCLDIVSPVIAGRQCATTMWLRIDDEDGVERIADATAQDPYGIFAPGRYAWILEDAKPTTERCPWCGGSEHVNAPEGTLNVCSASKYPQGGLDANGEERILGDHCNHAWTHDKCDWCRIEWLGDDEWNCPVCAGVGHCDPILAKGRQRVWEWTP